MARAAVVVAFAALAGAVSAQNFTLRPVGGFNVTNPAFMTPIRRGPKEEPNSPLDLWISQFTGNPFSHGTISAINNIDSMGYDLSNVTVATLDDTFAWPNDLQRVPPEAGLGPFALIVPDGFLVPGKSTGNVYIVTVGHDGTYSKPIALAPSKSGWFYHQAHWRDMNGDGLLDVVIARATKPIIGSAGGELIWLEQPASNPLSNVPWAEHKVADGPDVITAVVDLDPSDDTVEVFAPQFFSSTFKLYRLSTTDGSLVSSRTVDAGLGPGYWVQVTDLNMDGKPELLVTNHVGGNGGGVFAYTIPSDLDAGSFTRYQLATGFKVTEQGINQAAPGIPYAFKPSTSYDGPPFIAVAGDGSQEAYLMRPRASDANGLGVEYDLEVIVNVKGTVGALAVGDILGNDGFTEVFVPNYDAGYVVAYTFAPSDV